MRPVFACVLVTCIGLAQGGCGARLRQVDRIVLVTLDTTRADHLGCYGYAGAETPVLDALAREGVLFEQVVSPVPTTLASHSSIFTGLDPPDHGVRYNLLYRLADSARTLAEMLHEAGFATAAFPASQIVAKRFGLSQGFDHWVEPPAPEGSDQLVHPTELMRPADKGVDLALEWLASNRSPRAFVWLHVYDPHWPYTPPFPYSSRFRERPYDGEIAYSDSQLGRLIERLRADPQWERTLLIVTADHGEGLYEHGERYHSTLVYETTQRVPLIVRAPGARRGWRVQEPVALVDITPTILDLAGVAVPPVLRGMSLRPALRGKALPPRDLYFEVLTGAISYGWAELKGIRSGPWKLIDSPHPELFNLERDPAELDDLAASEPARVDEMRSIVEEVAVPLSGGSGNDAAIDLDAETLAHLSSLGYVAGRTSRASRPDAPHPHQFVDLEPELLAIQSGLASRRFEAVENTCRYALSRDPTNLYVLHSLATALMARDRPADALPIATRLVEASPEGGESYRVLATVYRMLGRTREAYDALRKGVAAAPKSEDLAYLSLVAEFDARLPSVCGSEMLASIERHRDVGRFIVLAARCQARAGSTSEALSSLVRAVDRGFRDLSVIESAPEFSAVTRTAGFRELRNRVPKPGTASRSEDTVAGGP